LHLGQNGSAIHQDRSDEPFDQRAHLKRARREHRYRAAQERIRKIVEGAPPLTGDQSERLAAILRGSS